MWYDNTNCAMNYLIMLALTKGFKFDQAYELKDEYRD